jgi:hypothetical protein
LFAKLVTLLAMVAFVAGAASPSGKAQAASRIINCGYFDGLHWSMKPGYGYGYHLTTRNVACGYARSFSIRYKGTDSFYPTWGCREINGYESFDIRCVAGSRVIRWVGGD